MFDLSSVLTDFVLDIRERSFVSYDIAVSTGYMYILIFYFQVLKYLRDCNSELERLKQKKLKEERGNVFL